MLPIALAPARNASLLCALACIFLIACGTEGTGPGPDTTICASGSRCLCETSSGTCKKTCDEGSCKLYCSGSGACDFTCDGGKCEILLGGSASATITCKGGGCDVTNTTTGDVSIDCAGNNCEMLCAGQTQVCSMTGCTSGCELSCYPLNEKCTNDCTDPSCK